MARSKQLDEDSLVHNGQPALLARVQPPEPEGGVGLAIQGQSEPPTKHNASQPPDGATTQADAEAQPDTAAPHPAYTVFPQRTINWIVAMNCYSVFISPLTTNIYFPALPSLSTSLSVPASQINLSLTTYMVSQGLSPSLFGALGDASGRRPAFLLAMAVFLAATIGLALQRDYAALLALRCLQAAGGGGTLPLAYGVVADVVAPAERRGGYMGVMGVGITVGPALGPLAGGLLTQYFGWPSVFWFVAVLIGVWMVPFVLLVPETARGVVGDGSVPPRGWNMTLVQYVRSRRRGGKETAVAQEHPAGTTGQQHQRPKRKLPFPNPFNTLVVLRNKDMAILLLYNSLLYLGFILLTATLSSQFADIYHLSDLQLGLCYLPLGLASVISSVLYGFLMDYNYRRIARQLGSPVNNDLRRDFPIEKARIQIIFPLLVVGAGVLVAYGWALEREAHLAVPLALSFLIGLTVTGSFSCVKTLVVDLYAEAPATATAANNLVRCLVGAAATAVIEDIIKAWGRGWAFTFIALLFFVFSPALWVVQRNGPRWREERRLRAAKVAEERESRARSEVQQESPSAATAMTSEKNS